MNQSKRTLTSAVSLVLMGMVVAAAAIAYAHHGPDAVLLDKAADKKGPVEFPHAAHVEVVQSCDTCHHTDEGLTAESDEEVKPCSACHLDPEDPATPSSREMSPKKNPYHISCTGCHKEEDAGPTKCNDCHGS